ncbi:MAG: ACT domain-containing protein [Burkholderiales bacterium]|nr:ACT domain-containing protein [Burkholderiales bacterium]
MSTAISNLNQLLRSITPTLKQGVYTYCLVPHGSDVQAFAPVVTVVEDEGVSIIVSEEVAQAAGLEVLFRAAWITLTVHSDLQAVGLTAAFSNALASEGISCNVVAGVFHDHIFVPVELGPRALEVLLDLQREVR